MAKTAFLELCAVIDDAAAAKVALADNFAFLLHGGRAAYRARDGVTRVLDLRCLGLILARIVQLPDSYCRKCRLANLLLGVDGEALTAASASPSIAKGNQRILADCASAGSPRLNFGTFPPLVRIRPAT